MAESRAYTPNPSYTMWRKRGKLEKTGLNAGMHAERKAYTNCVVQEDDMVLFEQDAFPCYLCDAHFLAWRPDQLIIFVVTEDGSGDRPTHAARGLAATAGYPVIIYYFDGKVTYNDAPTGAPAHPNPNDRN